MKTINKKPRLSIIIPAFNNVRNVSETIDSIYKSVNYFYRQNNFYPNIELLLVDNSTTNAVKEKIRQSNYPYLVYFRLKPLGLNYARDKGIIKAKYPYIVLTDSDCVVKDNWLVSIHNSILKNHFPDVIQGAFFKPLENSFFSKSESNWDRIRFYIQRQADGKNIIFKKIAYLKIGGYDVKHFYSSGAESLFLMDRFREKKLKIIFDDKIMVYHKYPDLLGALKRYNKFGKASVHIEYQKPNLFNKEFSPWALWRNLFTARFGKIALSEYVYQVLKISSFTVGYFVGKKHYEKEIKGGKIISPHLSN